MSPEILMEQIVHIIEKGLWNGIRASMEIIFLLLKKMDIPIQINILKIMELQIPELEAIILN